MEYQKSKGIYPCGIVGPRTRKALNNEEFITNKDYQFTQDFEYNDKGEEVKQLQTRLRDRNFFPYNIPSTGWFGSITQKAVNIFQKFYNLIQSGIVDEGMREVLNK
jgi:peptidoglycan hydrolase-like protein with peptidoglycan-binding domain